MAETNTNKTSYKVILNIILAHSIMISKLKTFCELKKEKKKEHYNYLEGIWAVVFKGEAGGK